MPNITLERFMIFNSSEGRAESREGDKLLFHWTKDAPEYQVSLAEQIDDVCLCDASVNVSIRLNTDIKQLDEDQPHDTSSAPSESNTSSRQGENGKSLVLTFENTLVLIVEVEPEQSIWMAVHVAPPLPDDREGAGQLSSSHQVDPCCIPADAIERVMKNIYSRFYLLNGTFQMIADEALSVDNLEELDSERRSTLIRERMRKVCQDYFSSVLPDIHLNSIVSNIASLYNYILYLDLNPLTLMKVNSFINHLVCLNANKIRHTIVIFNDQLLWSTLTMHDTRLLYNYLVSVLIRDALQEELSMELDKVRRLKENIPIYLRDYTPSSSEPDQLNNSDSSHQQTTDSKRRRLEKFYLTVFRSSNNMTLGLILENRDESDLIDKCEQILTRDSRLGVIPLASLAQAVGQNFLKSSLQQQTFQSTSQQQAAAIAAASTSGSISGWRRSASSGLTGKALLSSEQRYVFMNRLDASILWPLSMDMQNKEHLLLDQSGVEVPANSKKIRLIRHLIDFEPELEVIRKQTGNKVEELLGRNLNDSWLTITNSKYKTIYSINSVRNSGLAEVQLSAHNLRSIFADSRP